jgi:hypothetical protein
MTSEKIYTVMMNAQVVLKRCEDIIAKYAKYGEAHHSGNKETSALRRASMELTRALADLRRP